MEYLSVLCKKVREIIISFAYLKALINFEFPYSNCSELYYMFVIIIAFLGNRKKCSRTYIRRRKGKTTGRKKTSKEESKLLLFFALPE